MGQRSQIYVRCTIDGKPHLTARYFQWNFGDRMISRARYTIEWLIAYSEYLRQSIKKLPRIMDVNFDYKDVTDSSCDIIKEYEEYKSEPYSENESFKDFVFQQGNNDGMLFIDVMPDGTIKYCFTDRDMETPLTAEEYMSSKDWYWKSAKEDGMDDICRDNIEAISNAAKMMTADELFGFINTNYNQ